MPDALPAATLPIYPGFGHAASMLACILSGATANYLSLDANLCHGPPTYSINRLWHG